MEITTHTLSDNSPVLIINCENSSALESLCVIAHEGDDAMVVAQFQAGVRWAYTVPMAKLVAGLGEKSVGRFVNVYVKPHATWATTA